MIVLNGMRPPLTERLALGVVDLANRELFGQITQAWSAERLDRPSAFLGFAPDCVLCNWRPTVPDDLRDGPVVWGGPADALEALRQHHAAAHDTDTGAAARLYPDVLKLRALAHAGIVTLGDGERYREGAYWACWSIGLGHSTECGLGGWSNASNQPGEHALAALVRHWHDCHAPAPVVTVAAA